MLLLLTPIGAHAAAPPYSFPADAKVWNYQNFDPWGLFQYGYFSDPETKFNEIRVWKYVPGWIPGSTPPPLADPTTLSMRIYFGPANSLNDDLATFRQHFYYDVTGLRTYP